ncbi:N-acetylneuraminate synthase family protein [Thalassospira tepidiphila]|uniref:N-acetylneuraminate synthase family protein n=1 Tax=Thalassospira tepidiphila TaxID=393657 RepID=UPI003AA86F96
MNLFNKNPQSSLIVIAEIGVNHEGSADKACELVHLAAQAGADAVKLQSYTPLRYASRENPERFERVSRFALSEQDHLKIIATAKDLQIGFMSTPLTEDWVPFLAQHVDAFKIASGDLTFEPVIRKVAKTQKPMVISTGASTLDEIDQAVNWVTEETNTSDLGSRLWLMHCIAAYPAPADQAEIRTIPFLRERYGLNVGWSNHVLGDAVSLAAVAHGANLVEVHFTDQKHGRDFHDHSLSFEAEDLSAFIERAKQIPSCLGSGLDRTVLPCERSLVPHIRKGLIAKHDLLPGQTLSESDFLFCRTEKGLPSRYCNEVIGKQITSPIKQGFPIQQQDLKW